jgi:hypothetical protein
LEAWDLPGAEAALKDVIESGGASRDMQFAAALVSMHKGRHEEAAKLIAGLTPEGEYEQALADRINGSARVTKGYVEDVSAGGHFLFRYPPGREMVLSPFVLPMLERQREALGRELGYVPPERITVEVVPDAAALAAMTGLRESEIKATNTIAVCKYNRMMFITPEAMAAGYPFLDTLGHEYTHYVVSRKTGGLVEVWLHETISKMEESSWRGRKGTLREDHAGLLSSAIARGKLIPFAAMSPSMAMLPDADSAALAFAEVYSAGVFIVETRGGGALAKMLEAIAEGRGMDGGFSAVGFKSAAEFEKEWRAHLFRTYSGKKAVDRQFYKARFKGAAEDEALDGDVGSQGRRSFVRLGDLMMQRGLYEAASREFGKAAAAGVKNPVIQNRLASAMMRVGKHSEAVAALEGVDTDYPDFIATHLNLARASINLGKWEAATGHFRRAAEINPFDSEIWEGISRASVESGNRKAYDEAQEKLKTVRMPRSL